MTKTKKKPAQKLVIPAVSYRPDETGRVSLAKPVKDAIDRIRDTPRSLDQDEAQHIINEAHLPGERRDMVREITDSDIEGWTVHDVNVEIVGPLTHYKGETEVYVVRLAANSRTKHPYQNTALERVIGVLTHIKHYDTWIAYDPILVPQPGQNRDGTAKAALNSTRLGALQYLVKRLHDYNSGNLVVDTVQVNPSFDAIMIHYLAANV